MRSVLMRTLAAIVLTLSLAAPAVGDTAETAGPPADYTAIEGLSQVQYSDEQIVRETLELPMRDGISLHVEVTRPDADGPFPVVLEASPYHDTGNDREGTRIFPDPRDEDGNQIGLTGYFAPRGYAVVMMDLRGTGMSEGCLDHMGPADAGDLKEVVEWAAEQPWSNGRVGMTGHSYVGSTPMIAAAQSPRGLATIVPSAGIARAYDHQFQAGVAYAGQYLGLPVAYNLRVAQNSLPGGDRFGTRSEYTGCGVTTISLLDGPGQVTGQMGMFHAARDHTQGARLADIPVFMVQGTYDRAVRPPALEWFNQRQNPDDKLWYGQWDHGSPGGSFEGHPNRRGEQWVGALHAWFDKHLMQRDVDTGPPVEVFFNNELTRNEAIQAHQSVYTAAGWPGHTDTLVLYPDAADDSLTTDRPESADRDTFRGTRQGSTQLVYRTDALEADTLFVGVPQLEAVGTFTSQNLDFIVALYDIGPDGTEREMSQFAMNPALRNGLSVASPIVPDQEYRLRPPGWPVAHKVPAGHQLELRVKTTDSDKQGINTEDAQVGLVTGPHGTALRLPVVSDGIVFPDPLAE